MPFGDAVGGYPEGPGSEETHRPPAISAPIGDQLAPLVTRLPAARRSISHAFRRCRRLAASRRFRLQAAGLAALAIALALAALLPARHVRISHDGDETSVTSRSASDLAVVEQAGIDLEPGDVVQPGARGELVVDRATEALLEVDGRTFAMRTQVETIGELLEQAGVALAPEDSVYRERSAASPSDAVAAPPTMASLLAGVSSSAPASSAPVRIAVRRAVPFSVVENGQELQLRSSSETVAAALHDVGVRVGPGDQVQPPLATELTAGAQVHVEHAARMVVTLPDEKAVIYTLVDDVGGALEESGIPLPADYRLEPPADTPISAGLAVHVVGISTGQELETVRIESYTVYEPDASLPPGATRVVAGQDGVRYRQYASEYENGVLVSSELAAEWYDPEPVDTVIYYSTAQPVVAAPPAASVSGSWSDLVCSYDWDCNWALAVIQCESAGNPNAYNPAGYVGLFQIWEGHGSNLTDPATNIAAAYSLYLSGGPGLWPNCP